ncbi:hypothetical protein BDV95DRAFT_242928 [Massariosphaeria phaeospora]|uniref:CorA-like transporter domain-containing protein n=1 Tax=Massariosphaeria phaeospora TaxID=100035 RepID=A0A7C8HZ73_9PLEO|nr:hypothetical protein BDV95DRAFT_242928 [Massariosphaeria phaeospora]
MDKFLQSCAQFVNYPTNLIQHDVLEYTLRAYFTRLNHQTNRLFVEEEDAALDFLDLNVGQKEFTSSCMSNLGDLKGQLREALREGNIDPLCRFVFIHANHSRAPLRVSHQMICFLFSYLQVVPSFLDFVFPFGEQEPAQDFYFTGLKEESLLETKPQGLSISQLGRSGREMRICYNLRSVEESPKEADLPWSVRQTAVYHTFDFETGRSVWVTIKGNNVIKKRLSGLAKTWDSSSFATVADAFLASLKSHMVLCDWSVENWRWYINDLENSLQPLMRDAVSNVVDRPPSPTRTSRVPPPPPLSPPTSPRSFHGIFPSFSRVGTGKSSIASPFGRSQTYSSTTLAPLRTSSNLSQAQTATNERCHQASWARSTVGFRSAVQRSLNSLKQKFDVSKLWSSQSGLLETPGEKGRCHATAQNLRAQPPTLPPGMEEAEVLGSAEKFKFSDLQRIQYIEEKAQEVSLVLRLNMEILEELRLHYAYIADHPDLPPEIKANCRFEITKFDKYVKGVEKDLRMQHTRTDTLLRLLAERQTFLYGILQYQSMQASEVFAKKSQESASKMEVLTNDMHDIAQKTKQETVSMRIITLVTLLYLPGTFISTFMSTDIVKFPTNEEQHFQSKGLRIYLAICIPLMIITFLAWWLVYRSVNRGERRRKEATAKYGWSNNV